MVLGFDTATLSSSVALLMADGSTLSARDDPYDGEHPGHATRLLAMTSELLERAGVAFGALDRVAVGVGPGRFTGLRVGVATARGLAQSLSLELVGVSSLRALAAGAAARETPSGDALLAVIDARRGEVFAAAYATAASRLAGEVAFARALAPADLESIAPAAEERGIARGRGWLAVGDGAVLYRDALERGGVRVASEDSPLHLLDPVAICELGERAPAAPSLEDVVPDYRRAPDARLAQSYDAALEGSRP